MDLRMYGHMDLWTEAGGKTWRPDTGECNLRTGFYIGPGAFAAQGVIRWQYAVAHRRDKPWIHGVGS
jgi:hypothetical protein